MPGNGLFILPDYWRPVPHVILPPRQPRRAAAGNRRLATDRRGSAALQFALTAGPFIALVMAALQTSLIYFAQEALETSVETATRTVIAGTAQASDASGSNGGMTAAQLQARFKQTVCASLPSFLSCDNLLIDVESASTWNGIDTSMPTITFDQNGKVTNQFGYTLGTSGNVVMIRLIYIWPVQMAPLGLNLSNIGQGKRAIVATSVAKIENYS